MCLLHPDPLAEPAGSTFSKPVLRSTTVIPNLGISHLTFSRTNYAPLTRARDRTGFPPVRFLEIHPRSKINIYSHLNSRCISRPPPAHHPHLPSRYRSAPWRRRLAPYSATTHMTPRAPVVVRPARTHPGLKVTRSSIAATPAPSSVMKISSCSTMSTLVLSSRKLLHHPDSLPWLRPSLSCLLSTPRSPRRGAPALASKGGPPSP